MPKITAARIIMLPDDRNLFTEVSPGINQSTYASLFSSVLTNGDTTQYFKFLEEIYEKDPDVNHTIASRSSMITSKEWIIEGPNQTTADDIADALMSIEGDPSENLLDLDQLINTFLGSSYLTGISVNEVVTDGEQILGFNHIPSHFLTFWNVTNYPNLYTQDTPTGVKFNKEKMIVHYLNPGHDPARGYLGNAIGWQYVFKKENLDKQLQWSNKYGKGFLLINMDKDRDGYEEEWATAEALVENLHSVDGAVFGGGVEAEMIDPNSQEGDYFFQSGDEFRKNIEKIILGQTSTSDSADSNRSTAEVHMTVLEQRILQDIDLIESTISKQLLPKIKDILGIGNDEYKFKFVVSELEEDVENDEASDEENMEGTDNGTEEEDEVTTETEE